MNFCYLTVDLYGHLALLHRVLDLLPFRHDVVVA